MNGFYLAKRQLKWAGILDISCALVWSILIFIFTVYHFGYLLPNKYNVGNSSSQSTSAGSAAGIVATQGYAGLFNIIFIDFIFFRFTLWTVVLLLWIFTIVCFIGKLLLGFSSLIKFFKGKSMQHIYAALSVIFLPAVGGIIALNTYRATTSLLAPKYLAPHAFFRFKLRKIWRTIGRSDSFEDENKKIS